jgi:two-component system sensor histidine kinase PilS (NtrC family)
MLHRNGIPVPALSSLKPSIPWSLHSETQEIGYADQYWRSLYYFNIYRLIIGGGLLLIAWELQFTHFGAYDRQLFLQAGIAHLVCSALSMAFVRLQTPGFNGQLTFQVITDIILFSVMLYASGGLQSGLGVLLLVSLAGAGLISRGRLALFFASAATLSLLLQEAYASLTIHNYIAQYSQAGLLSMAYFAVAWSAYRLAKHTLASEQLARERGIDLAGMAQINQLVIQDLHEGILIIDKDGNIRQHNHYAEKLLGFSLALDKIQLSKLTDCAPELASRLASWQNGEETYRDWLRLAHTNALVRLRFLPIQTGFRSGIVVFLEDMERMQSQLEQLKLAAVGRLTANIAHEIRNPLSAINHAAELLEEEQAENNINPRLVRIICDNTQRLNKIVQDVLQLNRRNAAKPDAIAVNAYIREFLIELCQVERIDGDLFVFDDTEQYVVRFDRDHLNQVLWNLCRNALRHCRRQQGSVRIVLSKAESGDAILLDVIDDGPGIDSLQAKQIFEPFFTTATGGTGLGLYITRELCENNRASIHYVEDSCGGHFRVTVKTIDTDES